MTWEERDIPKEGPTTGPLERTSPTEFERMLRCMYRSALTHDPIFSKDVFQSTSAVLGSAAHSLKEASARGEFSDLPPDAIKDAASSSWDAEIARGYSGIQERALGPVPAPTTWKNYQLIKMAAVRSVRRNGETVTTGPADLDPEVFLQGHDGRLNGRVDLIRKDEDGVEIIDYKTGDLFEPTTSPGEHPRIRDSYRRQLLLYSDLYHEKSGEWPVKATVERPDGSQSAFITPSSVEATGLAADALSLLDHFNDQSASGRFDASPSESTCQYCPFKAACPSFFQEVDPGWDIGAYKHVRGHVQSLDQSSGSTQLMDVSGNVSIQNVNILHIPGGFFDNVSVGDIVSFSDLSGDETDSNLRFQWWSRSWRWS